MREYHVERLKPFFGSREDTVDLAERDTDQCDVDRIVTYRGDPETRTTMEFLVLFKSGDSVWLPYSQDMEFCNITPGLYFRVFTFGCRDSEEVSEQATNYYIAAG